jgi:c-di-GMP-binding flagellar brake protein YcgR
MENRKFRRVSVMFYLRYRAEGACACDVKVGKEGQQATVVNISEGGLAILTENPIPEMTKLDLEFHLALEEKELPPVVAVGQVCYNFPLSDQARYQTGVEFIMIKEKDRALIGDFIRARSKV